MKSHFGLISSQFEIARLFKKSLKIPKGGNQNPYVEEEQTTQWPKEKVQKDKQRSTKHIYKTIDRVTRTPLRIGGELRCSGRVSSSCYTSGTCHVNLVTNPVISQYIFKTGRCWTITHLWLVYQLYVFQHWLHYLGWNGKKVPHCWNISKIPHCLNISKIKYQNRRKRQNRYP